MTGSEQIEQIIRDMHYHGQVARDRWFESYEVALSRLRLTLLEAVSFGRDFRHLIPQHAETSHPLDYAASSGADTSLPPLPPLPSNATPPPVDRLADVDDQIRRWEDATGRKWQG